MRKLNIGDEVIVLAGKDKGRRGTLRTIVSDSKVIIDSINMVKKHTKGNPTLGTPGGIVEQEAALAISNVAIFNPMTQKADRIGFKTLDNGSKVRFFKSNNESVDG